MHVNFFALKITLTTIPFTLMGLPLAIFLGFRNSTADDRDWKGRKLWGELVLRCRSLSRQCHGFIQSADFSQAQQAEAARQRLIYRAIGFVHALGDEIEEPFGLEANDLPLDTLCRSIDLNLLESLGEPARLPKMEPVHHCLT